MSNRKGDSPEPVADASIETALLPVESTTKKAKKLTKTNLSRFQESVLLDNIEPLVRESIEKLLEGVRQGSLQHIKLALEISGIINSSKVQPIINNVNVRSESRSESTVIQQETTVVNSFESLVLKLDARDKAEKEGRILDIGLE